MESEWADIEKLVKKVLQNPGFGEISRVPGMPNPWAIGIMTSSDKMSWYKGTSLIGCLIRAVEGSGGIVDEEQKQRMLDGQQ